MSADRASRPPASLVANLAFGVSAVASPYVVTAAVVAVAVLLLRPTISQILLWSAIGVLSGAVIPFLVVYLMWRRQRLTDIHVAVRNQRLVPFTAALLSGALGVLTLYLVHAPPQLIALGIVYLANGLVLAVISLRWKISVHVAVLTAGIIAIGLLGHPLALIGLATAPVVLWARVQRGKHSLAQGLAPVLLATAITPAAYLTVMTALGH